MKTILANLKRSAPAPKSLKPPSRPPSAPSPAVPVLPQVGTSAPVPSSALWMEHIWFALIGKSYEEYRRDNPAPTSSSNGGNQSGADGADGEAEPELRLSNTEIDEFILDAHRAKTEKDERKQIRELVLAYIGRHHDL
jgi:hypothetical protein